MERALEELQSKDVESLKKETKELASAVDVKNDVSRLKAAEAKGASVVPVRIDCVYDPSKPLDGIIAHVARECGGNVHKNGLVKVTASPRMGGSLPENVIDLDSDSYFLSKNAPNSCYDFGEKRVTPTEYSIRSGDNGPGGHPESWVLEVSNDGSEGSWAVVDRRVNNSDLNANHVTCNFPISRRPGLPLRPPPPDREEPQQ